jgi:signal transduction histidine kinase/ActR/RegA family two-component response regulator
VLKSGKQDAEFYRQMWAVLQRGEVWNGHFINRRKDGTLYEEEANISPVRDAAGKIINYVAVKRDVTHEVQLETQFRQAQKMEAVGQLAGGVAHDFNNILAVIQMQSSLLKSDGLSTEQTELADGITESVQRAVALTRQLLLFSRREVFQPRDLELNETIAATTKMLKRMLGETIEMQLKLAAQPLFLHADAGMLDQVLMNLCVNARDAMPGGGHLLIETAGVELDELAVGQSVQARAGSFVRLSVSDNGGGIPPEILPQIFEPFFTTKDVGKGTGLGLATVFGIVQQHQGWINVYSEVGHGTTFRIYLPRLTGNVVIKSASPVLAAMRGGHETILLAEDDPALRVAVRKALSQLGYRILEAPTGVKALEVWNANRDEISLLLTDLVMPDGMNGKDLAQRLLQENPKLKVIYMSGYSAEVVGKDFPFTEDVNFLTKPFPAQKLAQTIRNCLDARR